jgi:hypothetical protein
MVGHGPLHLAMSSFAKLFVTVVVIGMLFIPGLGELLALPALAALGYIWGFAPTVEK